MKLLNNLSLQFIGLTNTIKRYPLTTIFLLAATITNGIAISSDRNLDIVYYMVSFLLGALLSVVFQMLYERFSTKAIDRMVYMVVATAAILVYYLLIQAQGFDKVVATRTFAFFFILLIAFLWIPSIKNKYSFNETFMASLKAFFVALIFSGVLYLGIIAIIFAVDFLIVSVDSDAYGHSANIVFILFAPLYLLSMIPIYPERGDSLSDGGGAISEDSTADEAIEKAVTASKFVENLISYIVIPLTAIFTIILFLYLVTNITGRFWTDNLLEGMLVAYSTTVIVVYLLASRLENKIALYFRKIFPKVLIPIVLFQTLSSIMKVSDTGITYGRYYVIIFGIFATTAGILFSFISVKKNGIIAPIMIALTLISIIPPVDAFTLSKVSQANRLKNVLIKNNMLEGDKLLPNPNVPEEDRQIIKSSLAYLASLDQIDAVNWLSDYSNSQNFEKVFGFPEYGHGGKIYTSIYLDLDRSIPIPIEGQDYFINLRLYNDSSTHEFGFTKGDYNYKVIADSLADEEGVIQLLLDDNSLIQFRIQDIFDRYISESNDINEIMSLEKATFTTENENANLTIIAQNVFLSQWSDYKEQSVELIVLIKVK